ncbi:ABC transporter ATP-binding protein [Clostridium estertheticum]|uniref:ABC transporter ATP-binding protein n=1 Tax=Clostridium estertheticum TaxID=238834 RepID=A0A7Y3T1W0_9CLOT|nr:ABC transporter ATP-binding protein [Clostridium estertheticum]NNU78607.1 ABC transporter ATP-binding protein [Clostridium estertheticum]WBL49660.1 ABC transporter ATP-binding protein [Clostridium estertheticum]
MKTICVEGLTKRYKEKVVLDNISFELNKCDIVGYLGKNGSGKTTTINILVGLLKSEQGKISILNNDVNKDYARLYGKIGIMFDENGLYEKMTVRQNIEYFLKLYRVDIVKHQQFIDQLFEEINYNEIKDLQVKKLSKGMKRTVTLVRTLMLKPEILILDEPFDGVDIENRGKFIHLIKKYYQENQPTIMLTSHVMADIEELANRIMILKDSKIIVNDDMIRFKQRAKHRTINVLFDSEDKVTKAVDIIKDTYPTCTISSNECEIRIKTAQESVKQINMLLLNNNIDCSEVYQTQESLSDIYLELINE